MVNFYLEDIMIQKKIYLILLVVLVVISSTTNCLLVYFYQKVNLDNEKNPYYNIYTIYVGDSTVQNLNDIVNDIQNNLQCRVVGRFEVGTINIESESYNCANFFYKDVSKFYKTDSGVIADKNNIVVDCNMNRESTSIFSNHNIEISNLIFAGDIKENISFVLSAEDYLKYDVHTYKIGIEFEKRLNVFQIKELKKIAKRYISNPKLTYEGILSKYSIGKIKNIFLISIMMILYTFASVMGIYQYIMNRKQKVFKIYIINGMKKRHFMIMTIVENILINSIVMVMASIVSMIVCRYKRYYSTGILKFTPYLMTILIMLLSTLFVSVYYCNTIYKKDISIEAE